MLDFTKAKDRVIALKAGISELQMEQMLNKQKAGIKIPHFIKINTVDGKLKVINMPLGTEDIEKKIKYDKERIKNKRDYHEDLAKRKGYDSYLECDKQYRKNAIENMGFKNNNDYQDNLAMKKGFKNYNEYQNLKNYESGRCLPMSKNENCTLYLGTHISENVLSKVFEEVKRMPNGNRGYDFICKNGCKIDVKSSSIDKTQNRWIFIINKNKIADYFLLIGYDNRENLNPMHIWLIKSDELIKNKEHIDVQFNNYVSFSIKNTFKSLKRFEKYELKDKLNEVTEICNKFKKIVSDDK